MALSLIAIIIIIVGTFFENEKLSVAAITIGMTVFITSTICVYNEYHDKTDESVVEFETSIRTDEKTGIQYVANSIFITTEKNISKEFISMQVETVAGVTAEITDMQYGIYHVILSGEDKTLSELETISRQLQQMTGINSAVVDIFYKK